jgi:ketosteroid isomerase-like protein
LFIISFARQLLLQHQINSVCGFIYTITHYICKAPLLIKPNHCYILRMKNTRLTQFVIALIVTIATLSVKAQKQPRVNAKKAVEETVEKMRKLMLDPDSAALSALAAPKLTFGHSSGKVQNKQEFLHSFLTGESDFTSLEFTDQTTIVSGSTAIVRHTLTAGTNDKGKAPGTVKLLVMLVWQKVKGEWILLARQAVKFPTA